MSRWLLLYENERWRSLRPLTDLVAVPDLAFGDSILARRWRRATGLPLLAIEARAEVARERDPGEPAEAPMPADRDNVLVVDAASLPGPWLEAASAAAAPALLACGGQVIGARLPYQQVRAGIGRGAEFERFLLGLGLPTVEVAARVIRYPWNLIEWNAETLAADLRLAPQASRGEIHPQAVLLQPEHIEVAAGARVDPLAVLDAREGPIRIEAGALVLANTVVIGPCVVGAGTQLLGGFVSRSTLGPQCRIAGEVEECIWQGFGNKRHHGFVGHSVIGEWVNLGALTTTSDLKNNYGSVRVWVEGERIDSGSSKVGSLIGAHVKTGIGTLLTTGSSIGVGSNLFGGGRFAPASVAPFSWWDGERFEDHRIDLFLATARIAMSRRGVTLRPGMEAVLRALFVRTEAERRAQTRPLAPSVTG